MLTFSSLMSASQLLPPIAPTTIPSLPSSPRSTPRRALSELPLTRSRSSSISPSLVSNGHPSKAPSQSPPPPPKSQLPKSLTQSSKPIKPPRTPLPLRVVQRTGIPSSRTRRRMKARRSTISSRSYTRMQTPTPGVL